MVDNIFPHWMLPSYFSIMPKLSEVLMLTMPDYPTKWEVGGFSYSLIEGVEKRESDRPIQTGQSFF